MSSLDIPKSLTNLIRLIMRGFYNIDQKLVIDILVRRGEMKEDDLVDTLKLDKKHLRSLIQQMKQDKFISVRPIMETEDGKSTRRNYYSINFRMFVNVVKYKIDHMRRKLETEERDLTSRASFICQSCRKTFTDLELGQIYDPGRSQFRCSYCDGIVDEDPNVRPKADSRFVMAEFNRQMEPIYALLQETEKIKLSIFEADRNNLTATSDSGHNGASLPTNNLNGAGGSLPDDQNTPGANIQDSYAIKIIGMDDKKKEKEERKNCPEVEALLLKEETILRSDDLQNCFNPATGTQDEDDQEVSIVKVNVGQLRVPITDITEEHVLQMDRGQRIEYENIIKLVHSLLYE